MNTKLETQNSKPQHEVLRMWLIWENEKSILVSGSNESDARRLHLPRSLIDRLSKFPKPSRPLSFQPVAFTLPEWKIEQEKLWEFVA